MEEAAKPKRRGQRGLGHVYEHRRNWWLAVWIGGKRHRRKLGPVRALEKRDARRLADEKIRELMTAPEPVEQKGTIPFSAFANRFLAWKAETNISWARYKGKAVDETPLKRAAAFFHDAPLRDITRVRVADFRVQVQNVRFAGRRLKNRTVNGEVKLLRHVFYKAIEWGETDANPAAKFVHLDEDRQRPPARTIDSDEEQAKLLGAMPDWLRLMAEFNLQTGVRRGDLLRLTWKSVHPGYVEFAETKECRHREIPLNDRAKAILEFLRPSQGNPDAFVFESDVPRETLVSRIRREWRRAVKKAAVPKIRFHDLRHTTATRLIRDVDVRTVQAVLGHASIKTTERYLHSNDKLKQQAVEKLGEYGRRLASAPGQPVAETPVTDSRIN